MDYPDPFLFRFKQNVVSPSRSACEEELFYDSSTDMMMTFEDGKWILAIDGIKDPKTKKCDIEKGEDQKDGRIWH